MKNIVKTAIIFAILIVIVIVFKSCKKITTPVITTANITGITQTSAVSGGIVTSDGKAAVTARGICWGTAPKPNASGSKTSDGKGTGSFTSNLSGLTPNTKYYVRAYATNSEGTAYGNELSFSTNQVLGATITTTPVTSVATTTAVSGGNITSDGGGSVTARGVCWATTTNPTTSNSNTSDGSGTGSFISNITGLTPGTLYYLRAYASNSSGTVYGSEVSFTTLSVLLPVVTTADISSVTNNSAVSGGTVTSDGGGTITGRGICWGTSPAPTIDGTHTSEIGTTGSFTSTLTGLKDATYYYFRAYATNSAGTAYGNEMGFHTLLSDASGNLYNKVVIGTQVWMTENLKTKKYNDNTDIPNVPDNGTWSALTSGAYCWYDNDESANKQVYGALYNWYAVSSGKLCPAGWHVPTDEEWHKLALFLDANAVLATDESAIAGGKLKEAGTLHWNAPNTGATNSSGFKGLPGGSRNTNGTFGAVGYTGNFWSADETDLLNARIRELNSDNRKIRRLTLPKKSGFSIRCIRD